MERVCDAAESGGDSICVCHPSTPSSSLSGVEREHGLLGALQLGIAAYLLWWLRRQQRKAVSAETVGSSLLVLPVYARFLRFEAWQCVVWGVFFFWSSYYDVTRQVPRGVIVLTQVARYVASFTWALCGEGVFIFLCLDSAGIDSLHTAVPLTRTRTRTLTLALALAQALALALTRCASPRRGPARSSAGAAFSGSRGPGARRRPMTAGCCRRCGWAHGCATGCAS